MASNLTVDTLTKGATTLNTDEIVDTNSSQICKAWVNFNGTGTVAIRDSYNVSSITDHDVGYYSVNFSNSMPDVNYSMCVTSNREVSTNYPICSHSIGNPTISKNYILLVRYDNGAWCDTDRVSVQVFSN